MTRPRGGSKWDAVLAGITTLIAALFWAVVFALFYFGHARGQGFEVHVPPPARPFVNPWGPSPEQRRLEVEQRQEWQHQAAERRRQTEETLNDANARHSGAAELWRPVPPELRLYRLTPAPSER